jgi:DNA-binding MarR family transcriptional regulator
VNDKARQDRLTLELLSAIEERSDLSQRHLARGMGVALGLANSYLKRCARKGYIKIREAPANRCLYYLTPTGFAEKARLTAEYLSTSLRFYRQAAESCLHLFAECEREGHRRILLYGVSDLAEIALLRSADAALQIVGVVDPSGQRQRFFQHPVSPDLATAPDWDAVLLTDLSAPLDAFRTLEAQVDRERIKVPAVLGLDSLKNHATEPDI